MNLAVIPARGGSRRIPGKNIKVFAGKPIIAYSIEAARRSDLFDKIIVSTDSQEVADVAMSFGAEVPFVRPEKLSDNQTSVAEVLCHAVDWFAGEGVGVDWLCCLVATAPFLRPSDIVDGCEMVQNNDVDTVLSVSRYRYPVFRAFERAPDGRLKMFWPRYEFTNSDDLPEAYHDAAQFYWLRVASLLRSRSVFGSVTMPVVLPDHLVCDIDTPADWQRAEIAYEVCRREGLV